MSNVLQKSSGHKGIPHGSAGKEYAHSAGDLGSVPGLGRPPGEGKATHSSILAWRIPWTIPCGRKEFFTSLHFTSDHKDLRI